MDLFNTETMLPGSLTQIMSDYSAGYDTSQFGTTDSVVVIGTAFDGPVGVPVEIYNPQHARTVFGRAYDSRTRKEATLTAGIQDAYHKGCRTIYGVRVTGKEVYKSFDLAMNTTMKLKVASMYPSNVAKDCFMVYDDTTGNETIRIYKPAIRATNRERLEGMVIHDEAVMVNTIRVAHDLGLTKDAPLIDLIRIVNENLDNNVLRLALVDERGIELSEASPEARELPIGAVLPGLYTIGRDRTLCEPTTKVNYRLFTENDIPPFAMFRGLLLKDIEINTDVSSSLPVFSKDRRKLQEILQGVGITMVNMFDFLEISGVVDRAFEKNDVDYEEADASKFEIYKRLGSGFAVNAQAVVRRSGSQVRVERKEVSFDDPNRIQPVTDGIYSMIENMAGRYRVLTCGTAEDRIEDRLPAADAFKRAMPQSALMLDGLVRVHVKADEKDYSEAKSYAFQAEAVGQDAMETLSERVREELYTDEVFTITSVVSSLEKAQEQTYPQGTRIMVLDEDKQNGAMYRMDNGRLVKIDNVNIEGETVIAANKLFKAEVVGTEENPEINFKRTTSDDVIGSNKFLMAEEQRRVFVMAIDGFRSADLKPIGDVSTLFSEESARTTVFAQSLYGGINPVFIRTSAAEMLTLEEFVDDLNKHEAIKDLFSFELTNDGMLVKDEYLAGYGDDEEAKNKVTYKRMISDFDQKYARVEQGDTNVTATIYLKGFEERNGLRTTVSLKDAAGAPVNFEDLFDSLRLSELIDPEGPYDMIAINAGAPGPSFEYGPPAGWDIQMLQEKMTRVEADIKAVAPEGIYVVTMETKDGAEIFASAGMTLVIGDTVFEAPESNSMLPKDRVVDYDESLYIPYKTTDNFGRQLAQHCVYTSLKNSIPAHGIIGYDRLSDMSLTNVSRKVDKLVELDLDLYAKRPNGRNMLDENNLPYPVGRALSVIFAQDRIVMDDGYSFISNGAPGYAGMVSVLPLDQSSTNQPITGVNQMFELTNYQLGRLTQKGIVTLRRSYNRGLVITDGITMAPAFSSFRRLAVTRIIGAVEELIREASEPFIGKQNNSANRNSLQTAIKSRMDKIKGILIENYDFKMVVDPRIAKFAYIDIDYDIVPIYEIRQVRNRIRIKDEL